MKVAVSDLKSIESYEKEKSKFYLLSLIESLEGSVLYSDKKNYIIGRSEENKPIWIWSKDNIDDDAYLSLKKDLDELMIKGTNKITSKKELYEKLLENYQTKDYFEMGFLSFNKLIKPEKIKGVLVRPNYKDVLTLAKYFQENEKETSNKEIELQDAIEEVELWIKGRHFFILVNESGKIVSMAGYTQLGNTAKITHVYTPKEERCKGYCQSLIYELTKMLEDEGFDIVLYTDYNYEPSNKAYKKVGYKDEGILINYKIEK